MGSHFGNIIETQNGKPMELSRLFDLIPYQIAHFDKEKALSQKENGIWKSFKSREIKGIVDNLSLALLKAGIKPGDKVAIIGENCAAWNFTDFALQQIGAISVPMYPTISSADYQFIFEHAEVQMIFVSDEVIYEKAKVAAGNRSIYSFKNLEGVAFFEDLLATGVNENIAELEIRKDAVQAEDVFTIIYTSGTTGKPKGVMLSHSNILSNVLGIAQIMTPGKGDSRILSFLPLCHIYERTGFFCFMYLGYSIYYAESMDTIGDNLKEVRPHAFNTVPRLLEKTYDKIIAKGYELKGIKRTLFFWALNLGLKYEPNLSFGLWYDIQLKIANKLVFSKWREALGGEVKQINSGASALQPRLARVFWAAGIKVCEGYGLTETSPVIAASICTAEEIRIGYVGKVIEDVKLKIAEDGEILVNGPNVMCGYYKQPELTAEVLQNGWFSTGDIGEMDGEYLKITDRKKEMFKTSGGKYIAPQVIENKFKESNLIDQLMVVGENKNYPAALVVPSFEGLREYCKYKGIPYTTDEEMMQKSEIQKKYASEIEELNKFFGKWEQIKRYKLLSQPWGISTGELTPTLKLRRKEIYKKYDFLISELYQDS